MLEGIRGEHTYTWSAVANLNWKLYLFEISASLNKPKIFENVLGFQASPECGLESACETLSSIGNIYSYTIGTKVFCFF